jgi:hypothetical protein
LVSEIALVYREQVKTKAKNSTVIRSCHAGVSASGSKCPRTGHCSPVASGHKAGLDAMEKTKNILTVPHTIRQASSSPPPSYCIQDVRIRLLRTHNFKDTL